MKRPMVLPGPVLVRVVELFELGVEPEFEPELVEPVLVDEGLFVAVFVFVLTCDDELLGWVLGLVEGFEPEATGVLFEPVFLLPLVLGCLLLSDVCVVLSAVLIW